MEKGNGLARLGIHDYGYPFEGFEDELFERGVVASA